MRDEIIQKVNGFLRGELSRLATYKDNNQRSMEYRIEHSYRVAHIAAAIAKAEGLDEERAFVAGLLHDVGYAVDYDAPEDYREHGRYGAIIARPFLKKLGYSDAQVEEMCFGIAIHVDNRADFEGERTPLALTIGDADNIDRFDAFRLYEGLQIANYRDLPLEKQRAYVENVLGKANQLRGIPFGTKTGQTMWLEKIDFFTEFFCRLQNQIENSH